MSGLSADHRRIFAGFDAKVAAWRSDDGFSSIGTSALSQGIFLEYWIMTGLGVEPTIRASLCEQLTCQASLRAGTAHHASVPHSRGLSFTRQDNSG